MVRDKSPVTISAGERLYTRWDYKRMFDIMAADYIQPDISHAGGIMELKKIAAEAESRYIPFAPHNPSGPVANAATLQLAASCPNFEIRNYVFRRGLPKGYNKRVWNIRTVISPFPIRRGLVLRLTRRVSETPISTAYTKTLYGCINRYSSG